MRFSIRSAERLRIAATRRDFKGLLTQRKAEQSTRDSEFRIIQLRNSPTPNESRIQPVRVRIDVVDYNVGLAHVGGVVELPEEEWDQIFAVNLKGCFLTMKHVIPVMEKQGGGSIINISSVAGIRYTGVPYSTYYATKAAMIHLTRTTAVQYAPKHIRVNAVLPGLMKTPMVEKTAGLAAEYGQGDIEEMWKVRDAQCPMGHMGDAWDVAYACLYLASDESKYVTGIELVVDGGISLKLS